MMLKSMVRITDKLYLALRDRLGAETALKIVEDPDKAVIEIRGWVDIVTRNRGKIVETRSGRNIWTNTGREYLPLLMSVSGAGPAYYREDRMAYIGVGDGYQVEDVSVRSLVNPITYDGTDFLAPLDIPPTFPLTPLRTTVRYSRTFLETEITLSPGYVDITEAGLFTDGDPTTSYSIPRPGSSLNMVDAPDQTPFAYKSFEPVRKTDGLTLEINWEIRF